MKYIEQWGRSFWKETEYRVKEITSTVEKDLKATVDGKVSLGIGGASSSALASSRLSDSEKAELKYRGQEVVSKAQVQDLSKVLDLVQGVFEGKAQTYYIVIDALDEDWVEDKLRYRLIMALIVTARDFIPIDGVKVILALRRDLLDRVFRFARDAGFQEEKIPISISPVDMV